MKIFLLDGQSNMQGCGNFGKHPKLENNRIFNFRNGKWQKAEEPLHDYTSKVFPDSGAGMAVSFGLHLVKAFRKEFRNSNLPVIAEELGAFLIQNNDCPYYQIINRAIAENATKFASSDGLTDNDRNDNTHFDTKSLREFGIRYAESYINSNKK